LRSDGIVSTHLKFKKIFYSLASKEAERVISMLRFPGSAKAVKSQS
jgi:hypothetical protein